MILPVWQCASNEDLRGATIPIHAPVGFKYSIVPVQHMILGTADV